VSPAANTLWANSGLCFRRAVFPGDYNNNGIVDPADYTVWRDTLGQSGVGLAAGGNGNGTVDPGDYDVWKSNFGNHSGSRASTNAAVPEPSTQAKLLILTAAGRFPRRRSTAL
jgi:hypothetical protein